MLKPNGPFYISASEYDGEQMSRYLGVTNGNEFDSKATAQAEIVRLRALPGDRFTADVSLVVRQRQGMAFAC